MESFVEYKQGKIFFSDEGRGTVVLLIHGFLENKNIWQRMSGKLSSYFRVICVDLPGHGKSDTYGTHMTMEFMADAVFEVVKVLNISKLIMIGHSMGGYVTQNFVERYSEFVTGFGYFHSHAGADSPEAKINRGRAIKVVEENHKNYISNFIPDLFTEVNREIYRKEIDIMKTEAASMNKNGIIGALHAMRERTDGYKLLRQSKVPTIFIIGKKDFRAPMTDLKEQIFLPEKAHVLILENTAHMGFIEDFDSTSDFISGFIRGCNNQ